MNIKNIILLLVSGFLIFNIPNVPSSEVFAHGGRTNSSGCHNQKKTGSYHCHNSGKKKPVAPKVDLKNKKYSCAKKYCKDMSSCDEAMYQYKTCGIESLDGDSDGVPCENVCPGG